MNLSPEPWNLPNNRLAIQGPSDPYFPCGPGQTFAGNYELKVFHNQNTWVQHSLPNPVHNFFSNIDGGKGSSWGEGPSHSFGSWQRK